MLAATGMLAFLLRGTRIEDDPIRSLTHPDPVRAALFDRYQEGSVFRERLFIEPGVLTPSQRDSLWDALKAGGYEETPVLARPTLERLLPLVPLLPARDVAELLSQESVDRRAKEALSVAMLPGGDAYLRELEADPLGLVPAMAVRLLGTGGGEDGSAVHAFRSPRHVDYERIGRLYDELVSLSPRVHFIGGDLFAVENYRAVKHDVLVCTIVSLALNLLIFHFFTGRWTLLGLLLLGSVVSNVTGILAIRSGYAEVLAVVLAYASTFVGFNNETLVHLSGIDAARRRRSLIGIWSAIGTTIIGFLILLLGKSVMVRQMALASIGGMAGFLLFLVPYRSVLSGIRFRTLAWRQITIPPWLVAGISGASVLAMAVVGIPRFATQIDRFRPQTPILDEQVRHFTSRLTALSLEDVVAIPAAHTPQAALEPFFANGLVDRARHPLASWRPLTEQEKTLSTLAGGYADAVRRLTVRLAEAGIQIVPAPELPAHVQGLGAWEYLELVGTIGPVRWTDTVAGRRYVMAGLRGSPAGEPPGDAIALSPRFYYDELLSSFARELGWLFVGGIGLMVVYVAALQRSVARVLYVFAPLFIAGLAFAVYARWAGSTVNIVHVMGFSLVIALATDYTAVPVATDHAPPETTKVLLTGISTLATFGVLLLARHPVLRELGATVAIGCAASLTFALLFRLPASQRDGSP